MRASSQAEKALDGTSPPNAEKKAAAGSQAPRGRRVLSPSAHMLVFAGIFALIFLLHLPLLRLPYVWDEAGYYIPAARDLLLSGSLIPHSTLSNAHPPLVMAWLAAAWKVAGYQPLTTRIAMLWLAGFTLIGVFRLAARVANTEVAIASTICTAVYPIFFTQSSLAHVDMAAAGFTLWGLRSYLDGLPSATLVWFCAAALSKETAIVAPLALAAWELLSRRIAPLVDSEARDRQWVSIVPVLAPVVPLGAWFAYHYVHTGYVFGNPEFFRYNVTGTLHPLRIVLAAALRTWQVAGYMGLWLLTAAGAAALFLPPLDDGDGERPRIPVSIQFIFLALIGSYVLAMAMVGGAVLARYMLPVLPLVIILWVSTLWRRVPYWPLVILIICMAFIFAWFVNPPYGFPFEDNLAYSDYIVLHEQAEHFIAQHHNGVRVLTAWPASDELTRPYLGYVKSPISVVQVEDFSLEQVLSAADARSRFDLALVFSTKYEPAHPLLARWRGWERIKTEFFGFHRDLPPAATAQALGGDVIYSASRNGQWIAIIEIRHAMEASARELSLRSLCQ